MESCAVCPSTSSGHKLTLPWALLALAIAAGTVGVCVWHQHGSETKTGGATTAEAERFRRLAAEVDGPNLRETVEALAALGSRVPGYRGNRAAADYMADKFREYGYVHLRRHRFPVDVPVTHESRVVFPDGGSARLDPVWPNVVRTASLPPEGLTAPLIDAGDGQLAAFNGQHVEGRIVLLDFNCRNDWLNAAMLGARAVIFAEPADTVRAEAEAKFLSVPADIPRFWASGAVAGRLRQLAAAGPDAGAVTLHAAVRWERREAENVMAWIPGSATSAGQAIVIGGYYDSMSVVPDRAPGAEQALSAAALLEMARLQSGTVRDATLAFVAFGAHTLGLLGAREFVQEHVRGPSPWRIRSFFGLDVTSRSSRLGLFYKGMYYEEADEVLRPWLSPLGLGVQQLVERAAPALGRNPDRMLVDGINSRKGRNWRTYLPTPLALDAEAVILAGVPALSFATADDARLLVDTPLDRPERIDDANALLQVQAIAAVLPHLLDLEPPIATKGLPASFGVLNGRTVEFDARKSYLPDEPLAGTMVVPKSLSGVPTLTGVRMDPPVASDAEGRFRLPGMAIFGAVSAGRTNFTVDSYYLDPVDGRILASRDYGPVRSKDFPISVLMDAPEKSVTCVLFRCAPMTLFDCVDPRYSQPFAQLQVFDAGTDSAPFEYGQAVPWTPWKPASADTVMMAFGKPGMSLRFGLGASALGHAALLLNNSADDPLGEGFRAGEVDAISVTAYRAARDMWILNESRLRDFQQYGITNKRVRDLHDEARAHLDQAEAAREAMQWDRFIAESRSALALESRAYPEVLGTANDVVRAVIFYLFLLLPFSYFMERLLCGFNTAETRIAGTFGFFIFAFAILSFTHPAFRITLTPFVVLLAFTMLALAVLVIGIVIGRFDRLIYAVKSRTSGIHESSFGRMGAAVAAFDLGVSNLRRRKTRTALTAGTLILLTFTLLSFVSVEPQLSTTSFSFSDTAASYDGILLRNHTWAPINERLYLSLHNRYGSQYAIAPRAWYYSALIGNQSFVAVTPDQPLSLPAAVDSATAAVEPSYSVTAVIGLTAQEEAVTRPAATLIGGRWLREGEEDAALIPESMARYFGIDPRHPAETAIRVFGSRFRVVGVLDERAFVANVDIDGEPLTPVDYLSMAARRREGERPNPNEWQQYFHLTPNAVMVLPYRFLMNVGGTMRSLAIATPDAETTSALREEMVQRLGHTLIAGIGGRSYVHSSVGVAQLRTTTGIVVPALIAALIVLNTMLGAVFERRGEIAVCSSVGLSPAHVSSLFLAEACVYGVLGGIAGYLVGQGVARFLSANDLLVGLSLNYSSLSTVAVTTFILLVTLLSTLYPAWTASKIATPRAREDVVIARSEQGVMQIQLPFTASGDYALGVNHYLQEFFTAHEDASVGELSAENIQLRRTETPQGPAYRLELTAWLVPFDLGVSQQVILDTLPGDGDDGYVISARMEHLAGDQSSWERLNRNFIESLRKQFLIWRSLSTADQESYVRGRGARDEGSAA